MTVLKLALKNGSDVTMTVTDDSAAETIRNLLAGLNGWVAVDTAAQRVGCRLEDVSMYEAQTAPEAVGRAGGEENDDG